MNALKIGQLTTALCLAIAATILAFLPPRVVGLKGPIIFVFVGSAFNIVYSGLRLRTNRQLQKSILFGSIGLSLIMVVPALAHVIHFAGALVLAIVGISLSLISGGFLLRSDDFLKRKVRRLRILGKPPFTITDNCAVDVRNLNAAREWYKVKLGLYEAPTKRLDDSGRAFTNFCIADGTSFSLLELNPDSSAKRQHVIFLTKNLEKAHRWFSGRGITVEPVTTDSAGNRFFHFLDPEGNKIEVCVEPKC